MAKFEIVTDTSTYQSDDEDIYGVIFIRYDNIEFPHNKWTDLCLSMLLIWGDTLRFIKPGIRTERRLYFMEAYSFMDLCYSGEAVKIELYKDGKLLTNLETSMTDFIHAWIKASGQMLEFMRHDPIYKDSERYRYLLSFRSTLNDTWEV